MATRWYQTNFELNSSSYQNGLFFFTQLNCFQLAHSSPFLSPVTIPQVVAVDENVFSVSLTGKIRVKKTVISNSLVQWKLMSSFSANVSPQIYGWMMPDISLVMSTTGLWYPCVAKNPVTYWPVL
jgi:hypothetical protein